MTKVYTPYSEHGALRDARVFMTPQVRLWYNHKKTKKETKEQFSRNVTKIIRDIKQHERPYSGHVKTIAKCEVAIFYMRLNDKGERIHFDWKKNDDQVEIKLLAVSNKKNIQRQLEYSAEHKVHSSTLDLLEWDVEDLTQSLDLSTCTDEEILAIKRNAKERFSQLPPSDIAEGWNEELFNSRMERATIYDYRFPNLKVFTLDEELPEILKLHSEQERILEEQNQFFLLEGVAGTGKTTILLYRFVGNVKAMLEQNKFNPEKFLFITHNERLKNQIVKSLRYFFNKDELEEVSKSVMSVHEAISMRIGKSDYSSNFIESKRLTRKKFKKILAGNSIDTDLFWEEYRGILRGYNLDGTRRILDKEVYLEELGRRRGKVDLSQRETFYAISIDLEKNLSRDQNLDPSNGGWDDLDLCKALQKKINDGEVEKKLDFLYIDEVQDLTTAELDVFLQLLNPNGVQWFAAAGDLSQSVQPSAFTWESLRDLITRIIGTHVSEEYRLDENYRSTPHLVNAANRILDISKEYSGQNKAHLQRPIKGENEGEPMFIFEKSENELLDLLEKNELPNSDCLLLTRDEKTKRDLKKRMSEEQASFIETIAKYKGLEDRDVLLWDPCAGSENILDLLHHPKRGEQTRTKISNITSGRLELNFLFVALTRARYLLGVLAPAHIDRQHFLHHAFDEEDFCNFESDAKIQIFGSTKMDRDHYLNRAEYLVGNGNLSAASGTYRQIDMMHEYYFYKGEADLEEENYPKAVIEWGKAVESGNSEKETGNFNTKAQEQIAEYSTEAIKASSDEQRNDVKVSIRIHAYDILPEKARNKFKGDDFYERGNFKEAAQYYFKANEKSHVSKCLSQFRTEDAAKKIELLLLIDRVDEAEKEFKKLYKDNKDKRTGIQLALLTGDDVNKFFPNEFKKLKPRFTELQYDWAKEIARSASNSSQLLQIIDRRIEEQTLSKPVDSRDIAIEHLEIFKQKKDRVGMENLLKEVVERNFSKEIQQRVEIEIIHTFGSDADILNILINSTDESVSDIIEKFPRFKSKIENYPALIANLLRNERLFFTDRFSMLKSRIIQKLISLSILAEYEIALEDKNEEAMKQLFEKIHREHCRRDGQEIVQACASLISSHMSDVDHPITVKEIGPEARLKSTIFKMLFFDEKFETKLFDRVIVNYSFHPNYKNYTRIDAMNFGTFFTKCIKKLTQDSRMDLYWNCKIFEINSSNKLSTPLFISNSLSISDRLEINDMLHLKKKSLSSFKISKTDDSFIGPYVETSKKLSKSSKPASKWFAKLIHSNNKYSTLWGSVFVDDSQEKGSLEKFDELGGELEVVSEPDSPAPILTESENNDIFEDDTNDEETFELFDEEVEILTVDDDTGLVLLSESFLTDEIIDKTNKGKSTLNLIKRDLKQLAGDNPIEANNFLHVAFNSVFEMDWPKAYQFAVLLSIWDIEEETEGFQILDLSQRQTFGKFKNIHQMDIIKTNLMFSARVLN
ncbi:MAG: ATP-dependent helicase [Candidatus Poseidoniaceae archaeon]|nr:ATP-dependent helicase [Candidatus Poseidoniaceae archaeon]